MSSKLSTLIQKISKAWTPPPNIRPTVWAERFTNFDQSSAVRGSFRALGWQPAILDAFSPHVPQIRKINVLKSARLGWTTIIQLVIGYIIHCTPANILVVQPTWDDVVGWGKENLENLFHDTPVLRNRIAKAGTKAARGGNTAKQKAFLGGVLFLIGAQSAAGFRRKTAKYVIMDELAGYGEPTKEGDQPILAEQRAASFHDAKIGAGSTPTNVGDRIHVRFEESDKGYYLVPCPDCREFSMRAFKSEKFSMKPPVVRGVEIPCAWLDGDDTAPTPGFACPHCGSVDSAQRHRHGYWHGETWTWTPEDLYTFQPSFSGDIGFFIWAGYSIHPLATPKEIVREYLRVKDDPENLKAFVNTTLGCLWQEEGEDMDADEIATRGEDFGYDLPANHPILTCGVDVQGNRLEAQFVAHGHNESKSVVDYRVYWGDTSDPEDPCWQELKQAILFESFTRPDGYDLQCAKTFIDTGHNMEAVLRFIKTLGKHRRLVKGIKGRAGRYPIVEDRTKREARIRRSQERQDVYKPELVGTDAAKLWLLRALTKKLGERRHMRFAAKLDREYYDQLTAERLEKVRKRGVLVSEWVKVRNRNEGLDTFVYALAAFLLLDIKPETLTEQQIYRKNTRQGPPKYAILPDTVEGLDAPKPASLDNRTVPKPRQDAPKKRKRARRPANDWDRYL